MLALHRRCEASKVSRACMAITVLILQCCMKFSAGFSVSQGSLFPTCQRARRKGIWGYGYGHGKVHHVDSRNVALMSSKEESSASATAMLEANNSTVDMTVASESAENEEEWEYEEFEDLTEEDFYGSEWKVGTVWNSKGEVIEETWVRLLPNEMVAVWGDGSKGKWSLDRATQFFSISKESWGGWLGKKIWAGVVDDFYYTQGSVRGWSPIMTASVLGQWQAKRLGVSKEEAGEAPWFSEEEEAQEEQQDEQQNQQP